MKMNRQWILIASCVLLIVCGIGWYWSTKTHQPVIPAKETVAPQSPAPTQDIAAGSPAKMPIAPSAPQSDIKSIASSRPAEIVPAPKDAESWAQWVSNYTRMDENNYINRMHLRGASVMLQSFWEDWPWPISSDVKKRLAEILVNRFFMKDDVAVAAKKQGISKEDPRFKALEESEKARIENEIRALVGEQGLAQAQQHGLGHMPDLFWYTWNFRGEAYQRGMPISREQRTVILDVLNQLDQGNRGTWLRSPIDPSSGLSAYDERALAEVRGVLSPEQLEIARAMFREANLDRAAKELRKARAEAARAGRK